MQKKQKITIQDIAKMAGISKTTVSRYLNGKYEFMSEETKSRISEVIAETGYRPNRIANSLKTSKSGLIGLVLSNISFTFTPFLMGSICDACMSYGKKLIVVSSNDDPDTEMDLVQELLDQQVEGLIVASGYNTEYYEQLDKTELPVILVDRVPPQPSIDSVSINHKDSTGNVIDNLIDKGYEKIYIITRKHNNPNSTIYIRIQAALSTCEKRFGDQEHSKVIFLQGKDGQHNILTDDIYSDDEIKSYIQATYAESAKYPVALFIADTYIFGRFICACYMLGITFSEHFTLAGYDSWNYKNFVKQSICTIEQPLIKLGDVAIKQLIKRINDNSEDQDDQVLIQLINNKVHC